MLESTSDTTAGWWNLLKSTSWWHGWNQQVTTLTDAVTRWYQQFGIIMGVRPQAAPPFNGSLLISTGDHINKIGALLITTMSPTCEFSASGITLQWWQLWIPTGTLITTLTL
jgi:hypothetical protein